LKFFGTVAAYQSTTNNNPKLLLRQEKQIIIIPFIAIINDLMVYTNPLQ
jgi:hypothetical protein